MNLYEIFNQLNQIPRPSHHEGKVADFLCKYAKTLGLEYDRDSENCVVIRKPASKGCENAEPVVLLNHMDMVAVSNGTRPFDPLSDSIESYTEGGWMKARGTSLGADNGIGLSMALAVLADDTIQHGPIEVLTTTNEEDGMSGAANLSKDFIHGRKVINLDSEDYDTITVGAAGAYLQTARFPVSRTATPTGFRFFRLSVAGGQGGHSGVDINKNRLNAIKVVCQFLSDQDGLIVSDINGGSANASIPSECTAIVGVAEADAQKLTERFASYSEGLLTSYSQHEPHLTLSLDNNETPDSVSMDFPHIVDIVANLPFGPLRMRDDMPGTVMTSNNIGVMRTTGDSITVSCHTRSFSDEEMEAVAADIGKRFRSGGASVEVLMNTPGWQERQDSDYLALVDRAFRDVLGFSPRKVAMHFVLEAGYYVRKYPGIEIACIGPRIVEPHSANERVELSTVDDIWNVLIELLKRLSE